MRPIWTASKPVDWLMTRPRWTSSSQKSALASARLPSALLPPIWLRAAVLPACTASVWPERATPLVSCTLPAPALSKPLASIVMPAPSRVSDWPAVSLPSTTCLAARKVSWPSLAVSACTATVAAVLLRMLPIALLTTTLPALTLPSTTLPWISPPACTVRSTLPVPASMDTPSFMKMPGVQVPQSVATTPSASLALASALKLPLSVTTSALMWIARPACSDRSPPLPWGLLVTTALATVMLLLACSVTSVPASSMPVITPGVMTRLLPLRVEKSILPSAPPSVAKPVASPAKPDGVRQFGPSPAATLRVEWPITPCGCAAVSSTTVITTALLLPPGVQTTTRLLTFSSLLAAPGSTVYWA